MSVPEEKEQTSVEEIIPVPTLEEGEDAINEKKLLRKIDWRLIPPLTFLFYLSFLDRTNIGNARIEGLADDTHMTDDQYLTTLTIWFAGYALFEIPCNIILKKTSPRFWLPTITIVWGVVCTLMGLTQNFTGLLIARFFLGVAESGLFPGVVFYLSMWYKRNEQHFRIALFLCAATLSGAGGGFLAFFFSKMGGLAGLAPWRWIFIMEGIFTVVNSVGASFFIYNYPATAKFLTPKEKEYIEARLKDDNDATRNEVFSWDGVFQAFKDPKVWLFALCFHAIGLPGYTITLFLPTIITDMGYTATQAQLLSTTPYFIAFIVTMKVALLVEKQKRRAPYIIGGSAVAVVGYILLITSRWPGMSYAGTILAVSGMFSSTAIIVSWPAANISGQTKRATASALQISVGSIAGAFGTQLYRAEWSPRYFVGHGVALGYLVGNIVITGILWYVMHKENARRDRGERDDRLEKVSRGVFLGDDDPSWRYYT